ncbi:hypothetical protein LTR84_009604 [Exophiala bonariae]|uniref:Peptidase A2 domain-containing protein n=1 Tax=Exophiala bonariae TaxID=1690606 RepID=A0AAV9NJ76_9EURO|nr:hypothetical protein LTR84_009604 [Exophiala bonariae]
MAAIYLEGVLKRMEKSEAILMQESGSLPGEIPWDVLEQNIAMMDFSFDYEKGLSKQEAMFLRRWATEINSIVQFPGDSAEDIGREDEVQAANKVNEHCFKLLKAVQQSFHLFSAAPTHGIHSPARQTPTRSQDDRRQSDDAPPPLGISLHIWCKADRAARKCVARHLRLSAWVRTNRGTTAVSILQDTGATFSIMSEEKAKQCDAKFQTLDEELTLRTAKGDLVVNRKALIKMRFPCRPEGVWIMFYIAHELPNEGTQAYLGALECWILGHLFSECKKCEGARPGKVKNNHVSSSKPAQGNAPQSR